MGKRCRDCAYSDEVRDIAGHYRLKCYEPSRRDKVGFLNPCEHWVPASDGVDEVDVDKGGAEGVNPADDYNENAE